jgi:hypothetical protein
MRTALACAVVSVVASAALAQQGVPAPQDYRTDNYHATVPATLGGRSRDRTKKRRGVDVSPLLDLLLNHATERKKPLVDRCRHLADEFDHLPSVFEDSSLPEQLVAELVDRLLIG